MTDHPYFVKGILGISKMPEYSCPVHGNISYHTIEVTIEGLEGHYCQKCYLEKLIELGMCRCEKIE